MGEEGSRKGDSGDGGGDSLSALGYLLFGVAVLFMIFLHELGHYLAARRFGVRATHFFVGFGPVLWARERGGTVFGLRALPLGGYVRILGMNPLDPEEGPESFRRARPWQRAVILASGSATHFLLAFLLLFSLLAFIGRGPVDVVVGTRIAEVPSSTEGETPAQKAGFRAGDRIVAINGRPVSTWEEVRSFIRSHPGQEATFTVERGGTRLDLRARLGSQPEEGGVVGFLGVRARVEKLVYEKVGAPRALVDAAVGTVRLAVLAVAGVVRLFSPGGISALVGQALGAGGARPEEAVSIYGAARAAGEAFGAGFLGDFLGIIALVNVFVGVVNLFPLPPLDGGHLALLAVERIRGRPVDPRKVVPVAATVLAILLTVSLLLLYLDIARPVPTPFR